MVARQVGGRILGHDSDLWKTLFPSDILRIDGRVPTENSSNFLLQMRMNSQKELIACAFSTVEGNPMLQTFSEFLLNKKYVFYFLTCIVSQISDRQLSSAAMDWCFLGATDQRITTLARNYIWSRCSQAIHCLTSSSSWIVYAFQKPASRIVLLVSGS